MVSKYYHTENKGFEIYMCRKDPTLKPSLSDKVFRVCFKTLFQCIFLNDSNQPLLLGIPLSGPYILKGW